MFFSFKCFLIINNCTFDTDFQFKILWMIYFYTETDTYILKLFMFYQKNLIFILGSFFLSMAS